MEGVHVVGGQATGSVGQKSLSGVHGKASVGSLGIQIPQKLKQNVKLV